MPVARAESPVPLVARIGVRRRPAPRIPARAILGLAALASCTSRPEADSAAGPAPAPGRASQLDEEGKMLALIEAVRDSGLVWIRNGEEMSPAAMAAHMKKKLDGARERGYAIREARLFVELNSRSLLTGRPYLVRLPDGRTVEAKDWLMSRLAETERAAPAVAR